MGSDPVSLPQGDDVEEGELDHQGEHTGAIASTHILEVHQTAKPEDHSHPRQFQTAPKGAALDSIEAMTGNTPGGTWERTFR